MEGGCLQDVVAHGGLTEARIYRHITRFGRPMHEQISLSILFGIDVLTAGMLCRTML